MPERYLGRSLGRFRVESLIGSGGFAWVYKGYDPELEIPVAIKVLKPQYAGEATFESRFRHEASTAAKLRHPNIIRILAVGREAEAVYFVMDYLPTGLDDRLRIMGTLPETLLIRLGMDVSAALAFAHREGVIHRDIKTDNILFDEHGNAIVADFGIARAVSGYIEQTGTNMVVGTPQYFSPEQARGQPLDGRADIYSLGVTLFKAATGVLPFQGDDWYDIARQHVEEQPPRPRAFNPALSRGIERVILKCLAKNPADRYPTGDALHTELVQLLGRASNPDNDATVVMPTPVSGPSMAIAPDRTPHRTLRRLMITAGVGGIVAVALVASALRRHSADAKPASPLAVAQRDTVHPSPPPAAPAEHPAATPETTAAATVAETTASRPTATISSGRILTHELRVSAPPAAAVWVDDVRVGQGEWRSESLAPGTHHVRASVPSIAGCSAARTDTTIRVHVSGTTRITLSPRPCGSLVIDAHPAGARWTVISADGAAVAQGFVPASQPIVLPEGRYTLRVSANYCADYRGTFTVQRAQSHREWLRLICN